MRYHDNMSETNEDFVVIRVKRSTRQRIKSKAVKKEKHLWEIAEDMSKNECL